MILNFLILSLLTCFTPPHDIAMAVFALTIEQNTLQLQVKVDREDIEKALKTGKGLEASASKISRYIEENTVWIVNKEQIVFTFTTSKKDKEFYYLETAPLQISKPITNINLQNTCLIREVNKHSNIIYLKQKDKEMRGFRMNEKRVQISITL